MQKSTPTHAVHPAADGHATRRAFPLESLQHIESPEPAAQTTLNSAFHAPQRSQQVQQLQRSLGNRYVQQLVQRDTPASASTAEPPASPSSTTAEPPSTEELTPEVRQALLAGAYESSGKANYSEVEVLRGNPPQKVKVFEKFVDPQLQAALEYVLKTLTGGNATAGFGSSGGDSDAKAIDTHPAWVSKLQLALSLQQSLTKGAEKRANTASKGKDAKQQWGEDSELAQAVMKAFLLEWTRRINQTGSVPANVAELYGRAGDSRDNERGRPLGGEPGGFNWCGPASERAAALGLMRRGLRFRGPKQLLLDDKKKPKAPPEDAPPAVQESYQKKLQQAYALAFQSEVVQQGATFLTTWATYKKKDGSAGKRPKANESGFRGVGGKGAETLPLDPGDYIYLCAKNSPLSGHVATIIREEWIGPPEIDRKIHPPGTILSKIYYVSGNAGPAAGGAVRTEQVLRELPPANFAYYTVADWGNQHDFKKYKVSTLNSQADQKYVRKLYNLFVSVAFNDKNSPFKKNGLKIAQFFQANWRSLDTMRPHIGGKDSEYEALLQGYQQEFSPKIAAAQAELDAYIAKMRALGLPFDKRDPGFAKLNTDKRAMPTKVDALNKMQSIFLVWAAKTKFMNGKAADYVKWWGQHKYDEAAISEAMGDAAQPYLDYLNLFFSAEANAAAQEDAQEPVETQVEATGETQENTENEEEQQKKKQANTYQVSPTGNFTPTVEGHIWVTSILKAGSIDPGRIETEIQSAQQAAAQSADPAQLDPAAAAPGADVSQIRAEVLDKWGLEDMGGSIDSLWPGALEYWEGLGTFG